MTTLWPSNLIKTLQDIVIRIQPKLSQLVRKELSGRDLDLLEYVFFRYYRPDNKGRWYDPYHILLSTRFAVQLAKIPGVSSLVVPGIILHDIGYSVAEDRVGHMREGEILSREILKGIGLFNEKEIGKIAEMVGTHDNPYIGMPIKDPDGLALRDADRIFVMSFVSFYKDWVGKRKEKEDFSLQDLYLSRMRSFHQDEVPYTTLAKEWLDIQFGQRLNEIKMGLTEDKNTFRKYAENYLKAEIKAGRG